MALLDLVIEVSASGDIELNIAFLWQVWRWLLLPAARRRWLTSQLTPIFMVDVLAMVLDRRVNALADLDPAQRQLTFQPAQNLQIVSS